MAKLKPAQEPSMEEILASIRQIISEDGESTDTEDTVDSDSGEPDLAEQEDESSIDETAADGATESVAAADDDEIDFGLSAEAAAVPEPVPVDDEYIDDDDEEQLSDLSAIQFDTTDTPPKTDDPDEEIADRFGSDESAVQDLKETAAVGDDAVYDGFAEDRDVTLHTSSENGSTRQISDSLASAAAMSPELDEYQTHGQPSEKSESQAMTATAPKPAEYTGDEKLISADAGASVANAFSTLTHTILSQNARTLDDLVSDMLQPMLKEWLDDNLPTLVERLVKQEIDRMARGGRG